MRALFSYGVAFVIILILGAWMATGVIVSGGHGPGNGEKPIVALFDAKEGGEAGAGDGHADKDGIDPAMTVAERNAASGNGADAKPRSVRIVIDDAQDLPIEVPLRGHTQAKASVSVVAQTTGIVQAVNVQKGQTVKAGDLICTLDQGARKLAVDQAQAAVAQAQTAFETNQALIKKGLSANNTGLSAQAALASANTALEQAQLELARTEIKADTAGVVADPLATVGTMLAIGQPCATVVQLDPMLFEASVPEAKIGYARVGLTADVTTVTGAKATGKVTYIAPSADDATRSFAIEIELPNADGALRDGITAEAVVNVGAAQVHVLPQSALTLDDEGVLGIRTVEAGSTVAFHAVNIIKDTRDGVWVIGLPAKINLITVGQEYVQPGQIVDAKTETGEPAAL
jgi:multidrug efflux system membrane fusion protein